MTVWETADAPNSRIKMNHPGSLTHLCRKRFAMNPITILLKSYKLANPARSITAKLRLAKNCLPFIITISDFCFLNSALIFFDNALPGRDFPDDRIHKQPSEKCVKPFTEKEIIMRRRVIKTRGGGKLLAEALDNEVFFLPTAKTTPTAADE